MMTRADDVASFSKLSLSRRTGANLMRDIARNDFDIIIAYFIYFHRCSHHRLSLAKYLHYFTGLMDYAVLERQLLEISPAISLLACQRF